MASLSWTSDGRSAFYEGFEGPEVSWQQAGSDTPHRIEFHGRIQGQAHVGQGCERIRLVAGHGSHIYFAHPIGRAPVIDELLVSVWVKSDRAGIQLLAQVVLPRTLHPRTGGHLTTMIQGTSYTQVGRWEQLRLENVPQQLARQVRVLRAQYGPQVDEREAYVSHVFLNIYGGPGVTNVWIDDLDVAGLIDAKPVSPPLAGVAQSGWTEQSGGAKMPPTGADRPPTIPSSGTPAASIYSSPSVPPATQGAACRLEGGILQVQGRPFFPRIIQYRGEPLASLQQWGFNVVWLSTVPSAEWLAEADRQNLWVICPPPVPPEPPGREESTALPGIREKIPPQFDRVLAWDVTLEPASNRLAEIGRWADKVRRADIRSGRPLVARSTENLQALSRLVDVVWLTRSPIGTLELAEYVRWLQQRELLVRPGTPIWVSIPTQLPPSVRTQWFLVRSGRPGQETYPIWENLSPEQIRLALYAGLAGGARGVAYESDRPLDASEPEVQNRAAALELLNRETEVLEPWLAAGTGVGPLQTSHAYVQGALWRTERARLALLFWTAPAAPYLVGQAASQQLSFLLPGLPDAHEAYQIAGGRLLPLRRDRTPGGTRVHLEEFDLTDAVLFSQDPLPISVTTQRAQAHQRRLAELHQQLALQKVRQMEDLLNRLPAQVLPPQVGPEFHSLSTRSVKQAQEELAFCAQRLRSREYGAAVLAAQRAERVVRFLEGRIWDWAGADAPAGIWPLAGCLPMLPEHLAMVQRLRYSTPGPNLLPAGDFEDLQAMLDSGWQRGQGNSERAAGFVELAQEAARSGRLGLRLSAVPAEAQSPPETLDSPPVWVISPPIRVQTAQCVRIEGWVQVPQPMGGTVDGLIIADSIGGEPLAWRIRKTPGWQRFEMYRMVPPGVPLRLSFVLSGLGEVWLDDVVVQPMEFVGLGQAN